MLCACLQPCLLTMLYHILSVFALFSSIRRPRLVIAIFSKMPLKLCFSSPSSFLPVSVHPFRFMAAFTSTTTGLLCADLARGHDTPRQHLDSFPCILAAKSLLTSVSHPLLILRTFSVSEAKANGRKCAGREKIQYPPHAVPVHNKNLKFHSCEWRL